MPTYGYECTACKDQFEIFQSIKDDALTTCEKCGSNLRKLIYPVGIAFKGSGFYVNDYAKPSTSSASTSKTSESTSDSSAKPEASTATETKPAAETKTTSGSTPAAA